LCRVLVQAILAHLFVVEQVLPNAEGMLDLGRDADVQGFVFAQQLTDQAFLADGFEIAASRGDRPLDLRFLQFVILLGKKNSRLVNRSLC